MFPQWGEDDPVSRAPAERLGYDPAPYLAGRSSVGTFLRRTGVISGMVRNLMRRNPGCRGVNLGAGLATYFERLGDGPTEWVDLDLPGVTAPHSRLELREERGILDGMVLPARAACTLFRWITGVPFVAVYRLGPRQGV